MIITAFNALDDNCLLPWMIIDVIALEGYSCFMPWMTKALY